MSDISSSPTSARPNLSVLQAAAIVCGVLVLGLLLALCCCWRNRRGKLRNRGQAELGLNMAVGEVSNHRDPRVTCSLDTPPHSWTLPLGSSSSPEKCSKNDQVDDFHQKQEKKLQLNNNGHQEQNLPQGKHDQTNQKNLTFINTSKNLRTKKYRRCPWNKESRKEIC